MIREKQTYPRKRSHSEVLSQGFSALQKSMEAPVSIIHTKASGEPDPKIQNFLSVRKRRQLQKFY